MYLDENDLRRIERVLDDSKMVEDSCWEELPEAVRDSYAKGDSEFWDLKECMYILTHMTHEVQVDFLKRLGMVVEVVDGKHRVANIDIPDSIDF